MKIKIYGSNEKSTELLTKVKASLEELGLSDFIKLEATTDESFKVEFDIKEEPALIIEEESIDFRDMIFEWIVPEDEELKSMFVSIIGWESGWSCGTGWCGDCSSGCG